MKHTAVSRFTLAMDDILAGQQSEASHVII
jgi:hypothetical protein